MTAVSVTDAVGFDFVNCLECLTFVVVHLVMADLQRLRGLAPHYEEACLTHLLAGNVTAYLSVV